MKKKTELTWVGKEIVGYFSKNKDRAEAIIEAAFPGYRLAKFRKDKGVKKNKIKQIYVDPSYAVRFTLTPYAEKGE